MVRSPVDNQSTAHQASEIINTISINWSMPTLVYQALPARAAIAEKQPTAMRSRQEHPASYCCRDARLDENSMLVRDQRRRQ